MVEMWLTGYLILASLPLVLGLCSTCLEERCYENGECILGCEPGYVSGYSGKYCEEDCPSRCLNKRCHLKRLNGEVICTDGCRDGYCGPECDRACPGGCVTCDRQCGSCNITLCPVGSYGDDCSEKCRKEYEKCDRETGNCTKCKRGYYGDECNRECKVCFDRANNIMDTCLSGCEICETQGNCTAGDYGHFCELQCSPGCDNPKQGCNKATGECFAGCVSGYHGLTCNYSCSEHCLSGICNRTTGECSDGCVSGYDGLTCNNTVKNSDKGSNNAVAIAVPITVIFVIAVAVAVVVIYWKNRSMRTQNGHHENGNSSGVSRPFLEPGNSSGVSRPFLEPDFTKETVAMVLLGKTGVGKSETGNTIVGTTPFAAGLSTTPVTLKCKQHTFDRDGQKLQLVDTPGFLGSNTREEDVKACVEECLRLSCKGRLHALLFCIEIGRFTVNDSKIINHFFEIFGEEAKDFVIVIFTKFGYLKRENQELKNFIGNAPEGLKEFLEKTNNRYIEVDNLSHNEAETKSFINRLLSMVESLFKENGCRCYTKEIFQMAQGQSEVGNSEEES